MLIPKIIDNNRSSLLDLFKSIANDYSEISIATGYWDLAGTELVLEQLSQYKKIRLLIGREPAIPRDNRGVIEPDFPDEDFYRDLRDLPITDNLVRTVKTIKELIDSGKLEVKVYKKSFLHAKCYIFGNYSSTQGVGVIGSSNFTRNGLTVNTELNAAESDQRVVYYTPQSNEQEVGHLFWFDQFWNDPSSVTWSGQFRELLLDSPVGDLTFSPYDMYIRTLWELYQDEIVEDEKLSSEVKDSLYDFQIRNAQLLLKKLNKYGLAMLADSVGLGKTITAGAVIKQLIEEARHLAEYKRDPRVYIIVPASLVDQWKQDLAKIHNLYSGFEILSLQDKNKIEESRRIDRYAGVDLFVIDEAHNLRNDGSSRHQQLLEWFSDNPESKVLLLTATPINNHLTDFVNQIQLAAKGRLDSFPVVYPTSKKNDVIDFFEAVKRLSAEMKKAETLGEKPDFEKVNRIMRQGLRHFLVRTTRKGIEKEFGGLAKRDGSIQYFPQGIVEAVPYSFSHDLLVNIDAIITKNLGIYGDSDPRTLDVSSILEKTQRTKHPLDILAEIERVSTIDENNVFLHIFQILLLLGFTPYRYQTYQHRFYGKTPEEISGYNLSSVESFELLSQMSIHNMLRINLLKRLESSQYALSSSLERYREKLIAYKSKLDDGYIIKLKDIEVIRDDYGDDIEQAVLHSHEGGEDRPIEPIAADPDKYNIQAMQEDILKDLELLKALKEICATLGKNDRKLIEFANHFKNIVNNKPAGEKVLVFSYYADTIEYLREAIPDLLADIPQFSQRSAYISGRSKSGLTSIVNRFSPKSKNASIDSGNEIDFLFATDVLSEGQNLQDCGMLINYDLHWNPVRMIQRNGRINRLGSVFSQVFIYNMHPDLELESYLKLVDRLQKKIERIKYTIGTDQSVLGEEENPIEYIDDMEESTEIEKTLSLYDESKAAKILDSFDDDSEFLSIDEYVMDLRKFIRESDSDILKRIQRIPFNKWGYYPEKSRANSSTPHVLSLTKITGTTNTGLDFANYIFIESDDNYTVDKIETIQALSYLKTTPDDNERTVDRISVEKERVKKIMTAQAREETRKPTDTIKMTPTIRKILNELTRLLPQTAVDEALLRISTKQEEKIMRQLFQNANKELKERGQILPSTIVEFEANINKLSLKLVDEKFVSDVQGVLFYAK